MKNEREIKKRKRKATNTQKKKKIDLVQQTWFHVSVVSVEFFF